MFSIKRVGLLWFGLLLILVQQVGAQSPVAWDLLTLVNNARTQAGSGPLAINAQLTAAAQRHSDDMAASGNLSHMGSDGSEFWFRIGETGYNMTSGAENVLSRADASATGAFDQWRTSPSHFANMMNPVYVEVGIAYAIAADGTHYFTMVLAARADFSPPTATVFVPSPTATLEPPTPLPPVIEPTVTATAVPPSATPMPSVTPTITLTPTPSPTLPPQPGPSIRQAGITQPTAPPRVMASAIAALPTWTPPPTTTPIPIDLLLLYDTQSFSLVNVSGIPLYIDGLYFEQGDARLSISKWAEFGTPPLDAFPDRSCLQAWSMGTANVLAPPDACTSRQGWVAVPDSAIFWQRGEYFTIYSYGEPVQVCPIFTGRCEVWLDARMPVVSGNTVDNGSGGSVTTGGVSQPTSVPQTQFTSSDDIQLFYGDDAFTLVNTSGRELDLTGLGFSSGSGILSVSHWDNGYLSRPLSAFPAGGCLQAWPLDREDRPGIPAECASRHAWLGINYTQTFWMEADVFSVSRNGQVLTTCRAQSGYCAFDLP